MTKLLIFCLKFILISHIFASNSLSQTLISDIEFYLGHPLAKALKLKKFDKKALDSFIEKVEKGSDVLELLLRHKKTSIDNCPKTFAQGMMMSLVNRLHNIELESMDAFISNKEYRRNITKFNLDFPKQECFSANLTMGIIDLASNYTIENFNPLLIYYGINAISEVVNPSNFEVSNIETLEQALSNITQAFTSLAEVAREKFEPSKTTCRDFLLQLFQENLQTHSSVSNFLRKVKQMSQRKHYSPVSNLTNIAKEFRVDYFESISSHPSTYRLLGMDYGEILEELNK